MQHVMGVIIVFTTFGCISAPKDLGVKLGKSSPNGVSSQTDQIKKTGRSPDARYPIN
ncbi:hypothetical protein [uncultured Ilyobacter sp.]|uniref:hypothetical protein n=1 Tax=uncultured Ilyobacter sp. TaxID=544433 RepID=UPI0029F5A3BC|nr:hypothetical protein [uncultured Ilyobacter sp.]